MGRKRNPIVIVVMDFGGSITKIVVYIDGQLWSLNMEPGVIEVTANLIEHYQQNKLGQASPQDRAWIQVGEQYYAVGFLASNRFLANAGLSRLKYERAWIKVLAALWVIKKKFDLPNQFKLALACLLPPGEYKDQENFEVLLREALASFVTPDGEMKVTLEEFNCKPEGAGIFMLHRLKRGRELKKVTAVVLMLGYRNASVMISHRGEVGKSITTDLGFVKLVEAVMRRTSGQTVERLATAISQSGEAIAPEPLKKILRTQAPERREEELSSLMEAIRAEREQFVEILKNWLREILPPLFDEVVLAGGTADYLSESLGEFFADSKMYWHAEVELPEGFDDDGLGNRLADVWCLYCYFQERLSAKKFLKPKRKAKQANSTVAVNPLQVEEKKIVIW